MVSHVLSAVFVVVFGLHPAVSQNCGFSRSVDIGGRFTIESPNYPNHTPGGSWCKWDFDSPVNSIINLNCPYFDGCDTDTYNSLPSGDWKYTIKSCGNQIMELNTTGNQLSAWYISNEDDMVSPEFIFRFQCYVSVIEVKTETPDCDCGKNNLRSRIVGGEETQLHEWPWQVYMQTEVSINSTHIAKSSCGGSLMSNNWVLTAAHCLEGIVKDDISLFMGEHDISDWTRKDTNYRVHSSVSQIIVHQSYVGWPYYYDDIALLRLSKPVEYSHGISPVCLPYNMRDKTFEYEKVTAIGWGRTSWSTEGTSDKLLEVDLQVLPNSVCTAYNLRLDQVCVEGGNNGESINEGDSGGPLVWLDTNGRYQQIGISSIVVGKHAPSFYTRVTSYIDWIKENTNIKFCSKD